MRRFYTPPGNIVADTAVITGADARHLRTVLRLKSGDRVVLFDGSGREYEAVVSLAADNTNVKADIRRELVPQTESPIRIIVGQALLKDKKMDILIRHLTELGIAAWIPFTAHRSVPRPNPKRTAARKMRWEKIATEALKQCELSRLPEIMAPVSFQEVLRRGNSCDLKIAFWENAVDPLPTKLESATVTEPLEIMVLFGPEGGFTTLEMAAARDAGFVTATLGPRIMRAETATLSGCTLVQYLFGDMR